MSKLANTPAPEFSEKFCCIQNGQTHDAAAEKKNSVDSEELPIAKGLANPESTSAAYKVLHLVQLGVMFVCNGREEVGYAPMLQW